MAASMLPESDKYTNPQRRWFQKTSSPKLNKLNPNKLQAFFQRNKAKVEINQSEDSIFSEGERDIPNEKRKGKDEVQNGDNWVGRSRNKRSSARKRNPAGLEQVPEIVLEATTRDEQVTTLNQEDEMCDQYQRWR
ncbi:uncharacterized protein LOC113389746 [Ctenocephalides felis]|uniref:uncharacterized protein LOC113389746 n=1 Tax=Ctenocephalides felis TaxID=7515 RepID=UPI000E6E199E|nr:uncharacterized protein LOC113389746 [Ctenocephalides felis]